MPLRDAEKEELRNTAGSESLRYDMKRLRCSRRGFFGPDGAVDADRVLDFLLAFNEFINHTPKRFRPIVDRDMKL